MKFNRSSRRRTQTRSRPEDNPPAGPARPQPPPAYPPQQSGYPNQVPPTLPGRPADPRYPQPGYPERGHPPSYPPAQPPPAPPPVYHRLSPQPPAPRRGERPRPQRRRFRLRPGCLLPLLALLILAVPMALYFLAPIRTNVMLIGIDYVDPSSGTALARSDTIMMATILPSRPYVGMISIPRDLWVRIPGIGENRINTAHFFAEGNQPGSGPAVLRYTIAENFGVDLQYYVRIRFEGFREIVDAMGGVDIELEQPMAGYPAGKHHLSGRKALAFVRSRAGADDFYRMSQGQLMIRAMYKNMLNPLKWPRIPMIFRAFFASIDTNIPAWMWPRLGLALMRTGPGGIDSQIINREMVTPFTTSEGAMVLMPNWPPIHQLVYSVFRN